MVKKLFVLAAVVVFLGMADAPKRVLADFETAAASSFKTSEAAPGSVSAGIAGAAGTGRHLEVQFTRTGQSGYAYVSLPITGDLSRAALQYDGISFRVKGDGSKAFGLVEIRCNDYVNIFQAVFPLDSTEWREVSIRWEEFFQINDGVPEAKIDWQAVNVFAFGGRSGWATGSFAVDDICLAKVPEKPETEPAAGAERLQKTFEKLRAGREVTLVALGDSITFGTKVPQNMRADGLYFQLVAFGLESAFPGAKVRAVNAGVGGDTVAEGLVRIGRDVAVHNPDLVMVLLGANDAIYRFPESRVVATMSLLVDKVRAATDAEVLLLGPAPCGEAPGVAERYAQALASLARDKKVPYCNLSDYMRGLAQKDYEAAYDKDRVHWSQFGHNAVGELVLNFVLHLQTAPAKPAAETGRPRTE